MTLFSFLGSNIEFFEYLSHVCWLFWGTSHVQGKCFIINGLVSIKSFEKDFFINFSGLQEVFPIFKLLNWAVIEINQKLLPSIALFFLFLTAGKIKCISKVFIKGSLITIKQKIFWWTDNWYPSSLQNTCVQSHANKVWLVKQFQYLVDFKMVCN